MRRVWAGLGAVATACGVSLLAAATPTTQSFLYDLEQATVSLEAGEWLAIPAECDEVLRHPHTSVVEGTAGNDVLPAPGGTASPGGDDDTPNFAQVVLGYAGNDLLSGGNQHDCLVGGSGDDRLVGNNGKDVLIGGPGHDTCEGENGKDVFIGCEVIVGGNAPDAPENPGDGKDKGKDRGKDKGKGVPTTDVPPVPEPTGPDPTVPEPTEQEPTEPETAEPEPAGQEPLPPEPTEDQDPTEVPEPTDDVEAPTTSTESAGEL